MNTKSREHAETLLDLAATGKLSRRALLSNLAAAGLGAVVSASAVNQAIAAGLVQSENASNIREEYDYIIVGAGAAGCALARRLSDGTDASILVLEAGGNDEGVPEIDNPAAWVANIGSERDWNYFYTPTEHVDNRQILLSRGKVLGGSSSTNALVWVRGVPGDYDNWAAQGAAGWDFQSVLPKLKAMEDWQGGETDLRGAGGPIPVMAPAPDSLHPVAKVLIDAGKSWGMPYIEDMNGPSNLGVGPNNFNMRDGVRVSTARGYLRPALDNPNLTVLLRAKTTGLVMEGTACRGVNILVDGEHRTIRAGAEVILCAGAIDTPRLLMLSGIGNADELAEVGISSHTNLPGVGQNLQEHILLGGMIYEAREPIAPPAHNLEGSTFFWKSRPELTAPDLMFVSIQIPYLMPGLAAEYPMPQNPFTISPGLMGVKSRGYIKMLTSRHDGELEIQPNILQEPEDREAMYQGVLLAEELANEPAFREFAVQRSIPPETATTREEKEAFIRRSVTTYFHPVGTAKMGVDEMAVTDPATLKVHGVDGLRIADASVMPSTTSANTHVPSILMGEMAADMIING
ncbi:GMC family oxidoreductase N-terminal domain-containing protein [Rhodobacteraceae bacterium F11138]|nr:GMC family oxidoreductase N-terminal domain-containing protein [Rhodobacteraceae bacterium F11138]